MHLTHIYEKQGATSSQRRGEERNNSTKALSQPPLKSLEWHKHVSLILFLAVGVGRKQRTKRPSLRKTY
jgi:hypothetical protein